MMTRLLHNRLVQAFVLLGFTLGMAAQGVDLIVELRTSKEAQLVSACAAVPGVESVSLLSHDGEARF